MKKLLCLFGATLLVLSSCSSDDDKSASDSTSLILPKTVKYSEPSYPSSNSISTVVYNGNKIVSIKEEGERRDYTYDGDVIIKITNYNTETGKDVKSEEETYSYVNNKIVAYSYKEGINSQFPDGLYRGRSVFTHNSDGTVKSENYYTNTTTGVETKSDYITVSTFVNGNLVKEVETNGDNSTYKTEYEYDSKNNPFKNILGFKLLINNVSMCSINNVVKQTSSSVSGSTASSTSVYKKEYVYDANGYPTKETSFANDGTTVEYIIDYIF